MKIPLLTTHLPNIGERFSSTWTTITNGKDINVCGKARGAAVAITRTDDPRRVVMMIVALLVLAASSLLDTLQRSKNENC